MEMGKESWIGRRSLWTSSSVKSALPQKTAVGVLTYEVSNFMSKVIHLWKCLSDEQIVRLKQEILYCQGVRKLVSQDEDFLLGLMCGEIIDNLILLARYVGRLGKKCTDPVLQNFERVFSNFVLNDFDIYGLEYVLKKMERKVMKMGRFVAVSTSLYQELEVLANHERTLKRMQKVSDPSSVCLVKCQQKVTWQRQGVETLRENSLWIRTYDYTVRLLARSLFSIFGRIKHVFKLHLRKALEGITHSETKELDYLPRSYSISTEMTSPVRPSAYNSVGFSSNPQIKPYTRSASVSSTKARSLRSQIHYNQPSSLRTKQPTHKVKHFAPAGSFKGCIPTGSDSPVMHRYPPTSSDRLTSGLDVHCSTSFINTDHVSLPLFSKKRKILSFTLGAAALSLHYANVIIFIEKLIISPHLLAPDARDNLYSMLPTCLRVSLRARLKSCSMKIASPVYDSDCVAKWSDGLTRILAWLAPLAHNMIRWQSERNLEQQHLVSRSNVLLVQTLYFADKEKTEAAITELLVGLNYVWRIGQELDRRALQDCTRGRKFVEFLYLKG